MSNVLEILFAIAAGAVFLYIDFLNILALT
jgi:hypothetical protein